METLRFGTVIVMGGEYGGDFTPIFSSVSFNGGAECFILCMVCRCVLREVDGGGGERME